MSSRIAPDEHEPTNEDFLSGESACQTDAHRHWVYVENDVDIEFIDDK